MRARKTFFHPASGAAILVIDWLFFGLGWEFGPLSLIASCAAAFAATYFIVASIQRRWHGDELRAARAKALLGAAAAGAPFAIGGTLLGGLILVLSGLRSPRIARIFKAGSRSA